MKNTPDEIRTLIDASRTALYESTVLADIGVILRSSISNSDPALAESYVRVVEHVGRMRAVAALDILHGLHARLHADDEAAADAAIAASTAPSDPTVN